LGPGAPELRSVAGVVLRQRGVIHPSFPLGDRWQRIIKSDKQAPSPSLASLHHSPYGTHLTPVPSASHAPLAPGSPIHSKLHSLCNLSCSSSFLRCSKFVLRFQFGTAASLWQVVPARTGECPSSRTRVIQPSAFPNHRFFFAFSRKSLHALAFFLRGNPPFRPSPAPAPVHLAVGLGLHLAGQYPSRASRGSHR
jgi:hypothetical protein